MYASYVISRNDIISILLIVYLAPGQTLALLLHYSRQPRPHQSDQSQRWSTQCSAAVTAELRVALSQHIPVNVSLHWRLLTSHKRLTSHTPSDKSEVALHELNNGMLGLAKDHSS
jgi:hypothetical protein